MIQSAAGEGEIRSRGWTRAEGITNIDGARRGVYQARYRVKRSGPDRPGCRRIQNCAQRYLPSQGVGPGTRALPGDEVGKIGVSAVALRHSRHGKTRLRITLHAPQTFVVAKIKDFIFDDRSADGGSELILAQLSLANA